MPVKEDPGTESQADVMNVIDMGISTGRYLLQIIRIIALYAAARMSMHHTHAEATPQPLSALPAGQRGIVYSLQGGHEFCSRVANLGFTMGAEVVIRQNYGHGPVLVALRGTLVALGRREASHVLVLAAAPN